MPSTEDLLVKVLQKLKLEVSLPDDPHPLEKAIPICREVLLGMPFDKIRVPVAVWLLKRQILKDPTVVTVIDTLKGIMSERDTSGFISEMSKGASKGRRGILVKGTDEDRLSLNFSLIKRVDQQ